MPVSLHPSAQNQPSGLLARVRNTQRRIEFFGQTPSPAQADALGSVLSMEVQEAYRLALQREAEKFGIYLYGELDPFTKTQLDSYARSRATGIVSTYLRKQADAQRQNQDIEAWRKHYASWKAPQIMQHEYASADAKAVTDFYSNSRTPDGKLLDAQGRVLPIHTAVDDECRFYVDQGWMPLDEILTVMPLIPWHISCPHFAYILPGSSLVDARPAQAPGDSPSPADVTPNSDALVGGDHPSFTESEVGTALSGSYPQGDPSVFLSNMIPLDSLPIIGVHIHPKLLIDGLYAAGLSASLKKQQQPPPASQP